MNRRRWIHGAAALLATLLLSCCASTTATTPAQLAALEASENGFLILDPGLADEITVLPRPFEAAGKGITVAVIDFRTTERDSMELEARTFFKNEQGITIQVSPWKRFLVKLHPASTYSAPTLTPLPIRCMTQIRRATEAGAGPIPTVELDPKATLP
jgi:hypothetical protein